MTEINLAAWKEWVQYRKEKRKPVSERAQGMQWKMLACYTGEVQLQIIEHSMMNDYQGLFPPKGRQITGTKTRDISLAHQLNDRSWAR